MLILVLAANTSFADFPRLASFQAGDNFMPRQLTKRGHRLVFSNGIVSLALAAAVLVDRSRARRSTGSSRSTPSACSRPSRCRRRAWRNTTSASASRAGGEGSFINGIGAVLSLVVDLIIVVTKFTHGAWVIVVARARHGVRAHPAEPAVRRRGGSSSSTTPTPRPRRRCYRHHVVLVLVERLDRAAARAIQYARTLLPDELRAVHVAVDLDAAEALADEWRRLGLSRLPLELVDCPDRRIPRAVAEVVAEALADGRTEVSVLSPSGSTAGSGTGCSTTTRPTRSPSAVERLPHANVTIVPYHLGPWLTSAPSPTCVGASGPASPDRVRSVTVRPWADVADAGVHARRRHRRHHRRVPRPPQGRRHQARHPHDRRGDGRRPRPQARHPQPRIRARRGPWHPRLKVRRHGDQRGIRHRHRWRVGTGRGDRPPAGGARGAGRRPRHAGRQGRRGRQGDRRHLRPRRRP